MFKIVFVCTGNRCRSPFAAARLTELAPDWVEVTSAGTLESEGLVPPKEMLRAAAGAGVDLRDHRAQPLTPTGVEGVDLVIGMALDHVAAAVIEAGAPPEKTFVLPELVELLGRLPPAPEAPSEDWARAVVAEAHALRFPEQSPLAVADPMGGRPKVYRRAVTELSSLCEGLARGLWGYRTDAQ